MPTSLVSPGIRVNELDFSDYAQALGTARLCVVGGATKGPLNVPTSLKSEAEAIRVFGKPLADDYGLQSLVRFFKQGQQAVFLRVANLEDALYGALKADRPIPGITGGVAATPATGHVAFVASAQPVDGDTVAINDGATQVFATAEIDFNDNPDDADTLTLDPTGASPVTFEFDDDSSVTGGNLAVTIGATIADTVYNLVQAVNAAGIACGAIDNTVAAGGPQVLLTSTLAGTAGNAGTLSKVDADDDLTIPANFSGGLNGVPVTFEFDDDSNVSGGNVGVLIGATAADTLNNLIAAINLNTIITAVNGTVTVPRVDLTQQNTGADGNLAISATFATPGNVDVDGMSGGTDAVPGTTATVLGMYAINEGTWGNDLEVRVTATTTYNAPAGNFDLDVIAPVDSAGNKAVVERYTNLSLDSTSDRFIEDVLAEGISGEVNGSVYVEADVLEDGASPSAGTYALGSAPGNAGRDGITDNTGALILTAEDIIGSVNGQSATGLQAIRNPETVEFNLLAIPGWVDKDVINAGISVAEYRADCLYLIDVPFGLTRDQVIDWHNGELTGIVPDAPLVPLDSSYAAIAGHCWEKVTDSYNKTKVWLPPSGFTAARCAYTDNVAAPWYPIAGHTRGILDGVEDVEYSPSVEDRDLLVGGQNRVNVVVNFAQDGATLFSNRTLQRRESSLTSLHVRRMLLHAEKVCATAVKYLVFEPNDPITWQRFKQAVTPHLEYIKSNRGIEDFQVICDESTNPPEQRQQKRMKGKLLVIPVEAAEIVELDFAIFASGAEFTES